MKLDEMQVLKGLYELHETIGRGGFAKVKRATHLLTRELVAIKILDKEKLGDDLPRVHREIETLKVLDHPHICKMYQVIETATFIFIVMEHCSGGELFDYIVEKQRLQEGEARRIFRQIAAAIAYVHDQGVAHRDLKPENILLDEESNVKLIDFGLCAPLKNGLEDILETCCGSPAYAAPELIKGLPYVGTLADVWSLGVMLYTLLCGTLPFEDERLSKMYEKITEGEYEEPRFLSEGSKNILRCMMQVNPKHRLSVQDLLRHTWFLDGRGEPVPVIYDITMKLNVLDRDVANIMESHSGIPSNRLEEAFKNSEYTSYEIATYLILLSKKIKLGTRAFRNLGMHLLRTPEPYVHIQKSLAAEFLECDTLDNQLQSTAFRHSSMETGLDDKDLLDIGSPKIKDESRCVNEDKENIPLITTAGDITDFARPRVPSPKKKHTTSRGSTVSADTPRRGSVSKHMSPARSADCVKTESLRTPVKTGFGHNGNFSPGISPARRKILGSLERGLDKVRNIFTPGTNKIKKPRLFLTNGKITRNVCVSTTGSKDPEGLLKQLKDALKSLDMEVEQKGFKLVGKRVDIKCELEIVYLDVNEDMQSLGIRRKRMKGDAWKYKRIMDKVLAISGGGFKENCGSENSGSSSCLPQPITSTPLQTMV